MPAVVHCHAALSWQQCFTAVVCDQASATKLTCCCLQVGEPVTPEAVLAVTVPELRACGLSERKVSRHTALKIVSPVCVIQSWVCRPPMCMIWLRTFRMAACQTLHCEVRLWLSMRLHLTRASECGCLVCRHGR